MNIKTPSASLMCSDPFELKYNLNLLEKYQFKYIHVDIMDGHFVSNIEFGFDFTRRLRMVTKMRRDIHLMMTNPCLAIDRIDLQKDELVTFHIESQNDPLEIIHKLKIYKVKVGIAINPDTPLNKLLPYLKVIDYVLVMTVYPGFAGKPYVKKVDLKILRLMKIVLKESLNLTVGVDGAIGTDEIKRLSKIGVSFFILGTTALFKEDLEKEAQKVFKLFNDLNKTEI